MTKKSRFNFADPKSFVVAPVDSYEQYRWLSLLLGESGTGKSTLLAQLPGPMAMVDIDGRAGEVADLLPEGQFYALSNFADLMAAEQGYADMDVVERSQLMVDLGSEWLNQVVPAVKANVICWDTITPIAEPLINELMRRGNMTPAERVAQGFPKNKESVWQPKASVMKVIRASQSLGAHCVWTAHYELSGKDKKAKATIPEAELHDFSKNLNVRLKTVREGNRYGVIIEWARHRPTKKFQVIWDEPGNKFKGMWQRIWEAIYGNGSGNGKAEPPPKDEPVNFTDFVKAGAMFPAESVDGGPPDRKVGAVRMAMEYTVKAKDGELLHAFSHRKHAENAYDQVRSGKIKGVPAPKSADEMATKWVEYVLDKSRTVLAEYEAVLDEEVAAAEKPAQESFANAAQEAPPETGDHY